MQVKTCYSPAREPSCLVASVVTSLCGNCSTGCSRKGPWPITFARLRGRASIHNSLEFVCFQLRQQWMKQWLTNCLTYACKKL